MSFELRRITYDKWVKTALRLYLKGRWYAIPVSKHHIGWGNWEYKVLRPELNTLCNPGSIDNIKKIKDTQEGSYSIVKLWGLDGYADEFLYLNDKPVGIYNPFRGAWYEIRRFDLLNRTRIHFIETGDYGILRTWQEYCKQRADKLKQDFLDEIHGWQKREYRRFIRDNKIAGCDYGRLDTLCDNGSYSRVKAELAFAAKHGVIPHANGNSEQSKRQLRALGFVA